MDTSRELIRLSSNRSWRMEFHKWGAEKARQDEGVRKVVEGVTFLSLGAEKILDHANGRLWVG